MAWSQENTGILLDEGRAAEVLKSGTDLKSGRRYVVVVGARILLAVAFLGCWQIAVSTKLASTAFISSPIAVVHAVGRVMSASGFGGALTATLEEVVLSFAVSAVAGVLVAIILDRIELVRRILSPYITAVNAIPRIALGPLFILWFGIGELSKIVLATSLGFFIVLLGTMAGLANVDRDMLLMARLYGANNRLLFFRVRLPWALPSVFTSLKLAVIYCMGGAVVGEMIAARTGLGQMLETYSGEFDIAALLAVLAILVAIVLVISGGLSLAQSHFLRWAKGSTDVPGGR